MKRSSVIWVIVRFEFSTKNGPVFFRNPKTIFYYAEFNVVHFI